MGALSLLEQLLQSGADGVRNASRDDINKYATGAAAGGILALLLGTRRGRRIGGSALKLGSMAALGMLAWKTYQDWQAQQQQRGTAPAAAPAAAPVPGPQALPAPQAEEHARALLKAMIAAAKADGHLDERERGLLQAELQRTQADAATRAWVDAELQRPLSAAEVAAAATTPEMAAEVYLASLLVADDTNAAERAYLDALARELRLADGLKTQLEARALATG